MKTEDIATLYARHPGVKALASLVDDPEIQSVACEGLCGSAAAVVLSTLAGQLAGRMLLVVLNDEEGAGYFYHDAAQVLGEADVLFSRRPIAVP